MFWSHKWKRRRVYKFVKKKLQNLLSSYYRCKEASPNSSKAELYLCALTSFDRDMDPVVAKEILHKSLETVERQGNSLNLRVVAHTLIVFGMPMELDHIVKQNTKSPFVWGESKPKLEDTFTTYYEIIHEIIPPNI